MCLALVGGFVYAPTATAQDLQTLLAWQQKLIYQGMELDESAHRRPPFGTEVWWLETDEGRTEAWFIPGRGVTAERPGPLAVVAHGNASLIDHLPPALRHYRRAGISVLLVEFRGYGRSQGLPTQSNILADFVAGYDRAVARPDVDAGGVVFLGQSLGGGVVSQLATLRPPTAVAVASTFTSLRDLVNGWDMPGELLDDTWEVLPALRDLEVPVLITHGSRDELIPLDHAEQLAAALGDRATLVTYPAGHADLPHGHAEWRDVRPFLVEAGVLPE